MDFIEFIEHNPDIIPHNLTIGILNAKNREKEFGFNLDLQGYLFYIKFLWVSDTLLQEILIKPKGISISGSKYLTLNFHSNRYHAIWRNMIHLSFEISKLTIIDFSTERALNKIFIDGGNNNLDVIINKVNSDVKIQGCNKVSLEKLQAKSIEISEVNDLIIDTVDSVHNSLEIRIINSQRTVAKNLIGKEFRLVGRTDTTILQHSEFENVRLVEPSFNQITFFDFDIIDFSIEIGNRENLEGKLTFVDSYITGVFGIHACRIGSPSLPQQIIEWVLKKQSMFPIYLDIRDNRINPAKVEFTEVEWYYNGILKNQKYPEGKRKIINKAKNFYIKNDDIYYTQILYSFEKNWYYRHHRFSFPLTLSKWSNNFGLNLWWPLLWMFLFILIESILILNLSWNCYDKLSQNWGVFAHLINPTHSTSIFKEILEGNCEPPLFYTNWLPVIDNFFRILIAYSIFQFANAFRYKFKLR